MKERSSALEEDKFAATADDKSRDKYYSLKDFLGDTYPDIDLTPDQIGDIIFNLPIDQKILLNRLSPDNVDSLAMTYPGVSFADATKEQLTNWAKSKFFIHENNGISSALDTNEQHEETVSSACSNDDDDDVEVDIMGGDPL